MTSRDIIRVCGLLLALHGGATLVTSSAHADSRAEPERAWLDDAPVPTECPTQAQLVQRVESHLGRSLREADPELRLSARYERTPEGYRLTLRTARAGNDALSDRGTREFSGAQCGDLAEAGALLIALSIDPLAVPGAGQPTRPDDQTDAPAPAATETPARADQPERAVRGALRAAGLLDVGYLPRAGAGAELGASVSLRRSRLELTGLWLPSVRSARAADDRARVRVALWAVRASYCQRVLGQRSALSGCAGLELGRASGDGVDLAAAQNKSFAWVAGWLALRASTELRHWLGLSLEPGVAIPFARSRFVSSDAAGATRAVLHTPSPVAARVALSLEALF
jgi:hypothetical protein